MTAIPPPMVPSVDAYPNASLDATGRSWPGDSYRPPMGLESSARPYTVERHSIGGPHGVNLPEAKQMYLQVYRSAGARDMMSSLELGHAAAYHAYRSSVRGRPLLGDIELERENLVGLAVAEASRLNHQFGRDINIGAVTASSEAAARTACRIFTQVCGTVDNEYASRPGYATNPYTSPPLAESEDFEMVQRPFSRAFRGRSLSAAPRPTFSDTAAVISDTLPGQNEYRMPLNDTYTSPPLQGPRYPPSPHPAGTRYSTMPQTLPSYSPSPYSNSAPYNNPGTMITPYSGTAPTTSVLPQTYQMPSYGGSGTMITQPRRRSASFSAPQPTYTAPPMQSSYTGNMQYGYPTNQPQTIVIESPKKHRHRHRHRHHHYRSRSR